MFFLILTIGQHAEEKPGTCAMAEKSPKQKQENVQSSAVDTSCCFFQEIIKHGSHEGKEPNKKEKLEEKKKGQMQMHYDSTSYALNFDEGKDKVDDDAFPSFSKRYANLRGNSSKTGVYKEKKVD